MNQEKLIRLSAIRRIACYRNQFNDLLGRGGTTILLKDLSDRMNLPKDKILADFRIYAIQPVEGPYKIADAIECLARFVAAEPRTDVLFVGAGMLGELLLGCNGFAGSGINIQASFNANVEKKQLEDREKNIFPLDKLYNLVSRLQTRTGIVCVPHRLAQEITNMMVDAGITEVWNWSGIPVRVPSDIALYNEELSENVMENTYYKIK
ncbi:MAG: hypothetical protein PHS41_10085 [Victivallaceae bacterium]|nr:hypothetical protein [Victivallaceae bacterium]